MPQAVNRPRFTMRNQTSFVSGKQSAVLFRIRPTIRFLCALQYAGRTHARTHRLLCHVEDSLALGNAYFWKTMTGKQRDLYCGEARDASLLVFPAYFRLTDSASGLLKQCFAC